jgi:hypothetical protein
VYPFRVQITHTTPAAAGVNKGKLSVSSQKTPKKVGVIIILSYPFYSFSFLILMSSFQMIFLMRKTLETPSSSKNWIRGLIIFI